MVAQEVLSKSQSAPVTALRDVLRVLREAKVSFVLISDHRLVSWRKKDRTSEEVDAFVRIEHLKKAAKVLEASFPSYASVHALTAFRMRDRETQKLVVELMKPLHQPHRELFKHTRNITLEGLKVRVASVEMAIVMKFSSLIDWHRADADRPSDKQDLLCLIKENPGYDEAKLNAIGSLLYPKGGKDVVEMARKAKMGEKLEL